MTETGAPDSGDWAASVASKIEETVDNIRQKTAVPLDKVAHGVVYGILAGFLGGVALILLAIAAVRALDLWVPGDVWRAHAIVAGIFAVGGLFLWKKRSPANR